MTLQVDPDGSLARLQSGESLDDDLAWDQWRWQRACEHEDGVLLHERLGNITLIGMLRAEMQREPTQFPILLAQVVYNGSHCGDLLTPDTIPSLVRELNGLASFECSSARVGRFMDQFRAQMLKLADVAQSVDKPIAF